MNTYNQYYDRNKTFVENLHDSIKLRNYKFGKDYIEVDLGEYIAFCPFKFEILAAFDKFFYHCVTIQRHMWDGYFKENFYGWGDLKTFYFKKSSMITSRVDYEKDKMWEFTCWLNVRRCRITQHTFKDEYTGDNYYLFHDSANYHYEDTTELAIPIIEASYDKVIECFMNSEVYKNLNPIKLYGDYDY